MDFNVGGFHAALAVVGDPILRKTLQCLSPHCHSEWGDGSPLDVFNRLLAKNISPQGLTKWTHADVRESQILSRHERWTTQQLAVLQRGHTDPTGQDFTCPIVLAELDGVTRVLDGNHRINRWVLNGDTRMHDVHIHAVTSGVGFSEKVALLHGA